MDEPTELELEGVYRCQFCGYLGDGWLNDGYTCPKCSKDYDYQLAQDSEE